MFLAHEQVLHHVHVGAAALYVLPWTVLVVGFVAARLSAAVRRRRMQNRA